MSTSDLILQFAGSRDSFTLSQLSEYVRNQEQISDSGILWHIKRMIKDNTLVKLARGLYGKSAKKEIVLNPSADLKKLYSKVTSGFPLLDVCAYEGGMISSMQHHLSANNALYIEVEKDATESVFRFLQDNGYKVYHRPTAAFMSDYVNLGEKCVIVKSLVTESPTTLSDGIRVPTLEKFLVDIQADPDFYYLQGSEIYYIVGITVSLYNINRPKLLRYASRRGIRKEMADILNYKEQ